MGGWCGKPKPEWQETVVELNQSEWTPDTSQYSSFGTYNEQRIIQPLEMVRECRVKTTIHPPEKCILNSLVFANTFLTYQTFNLIPLRPTDTEFYEVKGLITNKRRFMVDRIEKIENQFLEKAYELKKLEKIWRFGKEPQEQFLFHGTKHSNIRSIYEKNFNWRLVTTGKFGQGISFSPNAMYASNYSDKDQYNKIMIVAKVLIGDICLGDESMLLPDENCDTSKNIPETVLVKYEDHEYYPAYQINYHLINENYGQVHHRTMYNY